jgi:hypothetical protein
MVRAGDAHFVRPGDAPDIRRTERIQRPECLPRADERVPRSRSNARLPGPRASVRISCAGARVSRAGAVLRPSSPFFCAFVRSSFRRWLRPLRLGGQRGEPLRRLRRRPLRRVRQRRAPPLTAVDALCPPRYSRIARAFNSAEECHLHTVEAVGSIPTTPTAKAAESQRF